MTSFNDLLEQINRTREQAGEAPLPKRTAPAAPRTQQLTEGMPSHYPQPNHNLPPNAPISRAAPPQRPHSSADIRARLASTSPQNPAPSPEEVRRQTLLRERAAIDAQLNEGGYPQQPQYQTQRQQTYLREDMPAAQTGRPRQQQPRGGGIDWVTEGARMIQTLAPHLPPVNSHNKGLTYTATDAPPMPTHNYDPFQEALSDRENTAELFDPRVDMPPLPSVR